MPDLQHRTMTAQLTVRSAGSDTDAREVEGILVPWDQTITLPWGERERFERGAFDDGELDAVLYAEHAHLDGRSPIGRIIESEARDAGQWIKARISRTAAGDEAYELAKDGVYRKLSVGFEPIEDRFDKDDAGEVTVRVKARMREGSLVAFPAYSQAELTGVRHDTTTNRDPHPSTTRGRDTNHQEDNTMPNTNAAGNTAGTDPAGGAELTELRAELEATTRRLSVIEGNRDSGAGGAGLPYGSLGEWVRGLPSGQSREHAKAVQDAYAAAADRYYARAFTGVVTGEEGGSTDSGTNVVPTWIDRDIRLVNKGRPVLNLFSRQPLPSEGMTIEYPVFGSTSGDAAKQAAEGDDLAFVKMALASGSASVATYGGYTSVSRQVIERSSTPYVNKLLDYMKISYGKVTNSAVQAALTGATGVIDGGDISATNDEAKTWIDATVDAVAAIDDQSVGLGAEFWLVPVKTFKAIAGVVDSAGRPVFAHRGDGSNTIGTVNVTGLRANIEGLPVIPVAGLTGDVSYVCSSDAITVMESAGAPFDLNDENIINLTKAFSLYGYMALTLNDAKGIYKVTTTTTVAG